MGLLVVQVCQVVAGTVIKGVNQRTYWGKLSLKRDYRKGVEKSKYDDDMKQQILAEIDKGPPNADIQRMFNEVQIIPWIISNSNYVRSPSYQLDPAKTVFVGALHGLLSAEGLASIMNDLFGGVVYCGIDTDKHKYPIGSGRVTFNNEYSYRKAVRAAFIEIKTPQFKKTVQVDPYLADSFCQVCGVQQGPYFCREEVCFKYFCRGCWQETHPMEGHGGHKPIMRNSRLRSQTNSGHLM